MNVRRFHAPHVAGATYAEIGRECGCDWRTVRKYSAEDAPSVPPFAPPRSGTQPRLITPFVAVVESWLRADVALKGTVVHERLVAEHGFAGSYQRVKMFLAEARPRIAAELAEHDENPLTGLHRRFDVVAGAQAQVDSGDEGDVLGHVGIGNVYSFHLVLSHSRDPFACFTTSMDLATFWDCHRRAFAHFGGVPATIVYDRTKTVIKRHVAPGVAVPLHPEAAAFAEDYGFTIDVLAAYQPTGKGRVERQVVIVRDHVLAGRRFDSLAELNGAFAGWLTVRRAQVHRTHGQVIAVRAEVDRTALLPLPEQPYLVTDKHPRRAGLRLPGLVRGQLLLRPGTPDPVRATRPAAGRRRRRHHPRGQRRRRPLAGHPPQGERPWLLGHRPDSLGCAARQTHPRRHRRPAWPRPRCPRRRIGARAAPRAAGTAGTLDQPSPLAALLGTNHAAATPVARRPLTDYQAAALARPIHHN